MRSFLGDSGFSVQGIKWRVDPEVGVVLAVAVRGNSANLTARDSVRDACSDLVSQRDFRELASGFQVLEVSVQVSSGVEDGVLPTARERLRPPAEPAFTIVALSGCGFSTGICLSADATLLSLHAKPRPKVCLLPTASHDSPSLISRYYETFESLACDPTHLELALRSPTHQNRARVEETLLKQDLLYVSGGNTGDLLDVWVRWELPPLLRFLGTQGCVLAGVSAGAACWFQSFITDCQGPQLVEMAGLGFLKGSYSPHYDEPERRAAFHRLVREGTPSGYGADNATALYFVGGTLQRVLAMDDSAGCYAISQSPNGDVDERIIS